MLASGSPSAKFPSPWLKPLVIPLAAAVDFHCVFDDIKSKHFSNALRDSNLQLHTSTSRSRFGQGPRFRSAQVCVFTYFGIRRLREKSLLGFDWTCVGAGLHQKRVNIRIAIIMTATMILAQQQYWLHNACYRLYLESRYLQLFSQKSFMSKWWFSSKAEVWNFTKNKLLKLVNSMKIDYLFAGLNLNIIIQKRVRKCTFYRRCFKIKGY